MSSPCVVVVASWNWLFRLDQYLTVEKDQAFSQPAALALGDSGLPFLEAMPAIAVGGCARLWVPLARRLIL